MSKNLLLALILGLMISCNKQESTRTSLTDGAQGCSSDLVESSTTGALFEVNGQKVVRADLPGGLKDALYQNEFSAYSKNQTIFEELALRIYLGKKKNKLKDPKNPPSLLDLLDIPEPTDSEMKALFERSKGQLPPGTKFDGPIKAQIVQYLKGQKVGSVFQAEVKKMKAAGAYRMLVAAPIAPELKLSLSGFPVKGKKDSRIQVVEVSDYTCGHCQRAHTQVMSLLKKYGDRIAFTQVNFSLRPDGASGLYIRGAYCAQKESEEKFWVYHDEAFKKTSEPHHHDHGAGGHSEHEDQDKVVAIAEKAQLKMDVFKKCIESEEAKKYVKVTANSLAEQGISGTPVFLINNKKVGGGVAALEEEIKKQL